MKVNAVLLRTDDNVVTVVEPVNKGEEAAYLKKSENGEQEAISVKAIEDIPIYHKIALTDFKEGDYVVKYGQIIGAAMSEAKKGSLMNHFNIKSLPRDYDSEY